MTTIRYSADKDWITLRASGHAGYAEQGKDVVCAALSAIASTFYLYAESKGGTVEGGGTNDGYVNVSVRSNRETKEVASAIMMGIKALCDMYPENVRMV